jgi:hypothetical protein
VTVDSKPVIVGLCVVATLIALLIAAAATDLEHAWAWYQHRAVWAIASTVSNVPIS